MFGDRISKEEWPLSVKMAEYLINRSPNRTNPNWKTPYEMYNGKVPDLSHLIIPGCEAYVHVDKQRSDDTKLEHRAVERVVMGYTSNGYIVMDPRTRKSYCTCNITAIEDKGYADVVNDLKDELVDVYLDLQPNIPSFEIDHSYGWSYVSGSMETCMSISDCVPTTYEEAIESPFSQEWKSVMALEIDSLLENGTWLEVTANENVPKKLISTKWVFVVKYDGEKEFAKARIVARGFQDNNHYDSEDTYAPVINQTVFRWMLSIASRFDLMIFTIEVCTAFLYG